MRYILILEDNIKTLQALANSIQKISSDIIVHQVQSLEKAYSIAYKYKIDVFILDIILRTKEPGDTSGISFASQLRKYEEYRFTPIIFITALADPQLYAYSYLHSYGYLEKPFSMDRAIKLVKEALHYRLNVVPDKTIFWRKDGILYPVRISNIIYIEVKRHFLFIHMKEDVLEIPYVTMKNFLKDVVGFGFIQCSRNIAVNKQYIKSIDSINKYIQLKDIDDNVEIGPTFCRKIFREL